MNNWFREHRTSIGWLISGMGIFWLGVFLAVYFFPDPFRPAVSWPFTTTTVAIYIQALILWYAIASKRHEHREIMQSFQERSRPDLYFDDINWDLAPDPENPGIYVFKVFHAIKNGGLQLASDVMLVGDAKVLSAEIAEDDYKINNEYQRWKEDVVTMTNFKGPGSFIPPNGAIVKFFGGTEELQSVDYERLLNRKNYLCFFAAVSYCDRTKIHSYATPLILIIDLIATGLPKKFEELKDFDMSTVRIVFWTRPCYTKAI